MHRALNCNVVDSEWAKTAWGKLFLASFLKELPASEALSEKIRSNEHYQRKMNHLLNWVVVLKQNHSKKIKFKKNWIQNVETDQIPLGKTSVKAGSTKPNFWTCLGNICVWRLLPVDTTVSHSL